MMDLLTEMAQDWLGRLILALLAVLIGVLLGIPLLLVRHAEEQRQWEAFAAKHQCRVVSVVPGVMTQTPMMVGKVLVLVPQTGPARTTYLCNDERSYTR